MKFKMFFDKLMIIQEGTMSQCERCGWYGDEPAAGLINNCFNDELPEEEHNRVRNHGGDNCQGFVEAEMNE